VRPFFENPIWVSCIISLSAKNKSNLLHNTVINCYSSIVNRIIRIICLKYRTYKTFNNVSNEMLKASQSYMNPCLLKLFNTVFTSGIYPSKWSESFVCPVFKADDPN
jgi:hypothetical protein